ncbi:uncharacterized protein LOC120920999 isoform X1 [Rana temporaria]|uniref:uncharacterized protein LOC120920999 isoform X1 n=1 Tax=Rana temporaria TaxID=8407 RepID=UPI001AAC72E2|nr:uncharacterized protein LOC120920999 isoform X1 [Rana temporaria]XP_040189501.1 uncharacterized protein LOC120920999 isoform X1 [Rana temporaria]
MDRIVLIFFILITHGVPAENSSNTISIYAHEEDAVFLPLPEHLLNQTDYVWKKGKEHIATSFRNGSIHIPDLKYRDILNSSHDGSLIIKAQEWGNKDKYSVDVKMNDSLSTIHYFVKVQNHKFIPHAKGPINVSATVGGKCTLPLEDGDYERSKIVKIDWLTKRWAYFAETKTDGVISILEDIYEGKLSSSPEGCLIFNNVRKRNQGVYRACIFLNNGKIFEQMYQVSISDHNYISHAKGPNVEPDFDERTSTDSASDSENIINIHLVTISVLIGVSIFTIVLVTIYRYNIYQHKSNKGKMETMFDPKEYNKTRTNHDTSHLESQTHSQTHSCVTFPATSPTPPMVPLL